MQLHTPTRVAKCASNVHCGVRAGRAQPLSTGGGYALEPVAAEEAADGEGAVLALPPVMHGYS